MKCAFQWRRVSRLAILFLSIAILTARMAAAQNTASPVPQGSVGLATYATMSQFKDLDVKASEQPLVHRTLSEGLDDFEVGGGQWKVVDGLLKQSDAAATGVAAFTGKRTWTDYVVSVKARKVAGKEGFMLAFRAHDAKNFAWLNVGGWGNSRAQIELTTNGTRNEIGDATTMRVEEDRWYDVKVDVKGDEATGYIDDKKVAWAKLITPPSQPGAARGGRAGRAGGGGNTPTAVATPISTSTGLWDKLMFVGATAVIVGAVAVGVMWARTRLSGKAA